MLGLELFFDIAPSVTDAIALATARLNRSPSRA